MFVNGLGYAQFAGASKFATVFGSTTSGAGRKESSGKLNKLRANVPAMSRFVMVSASTSYTGMVGKVPTGYQFAPRFNVANTPASVATTQMLSLSAWI